MGKKKRVKERAAAYAELDITKGSGKKYGKKENSGNWKKPVAIIASILVVVIVAGTLIFNFLATSNIVQTSKVVMKSEHLTINAAMMEYVMNSKYQQFVSSYSSYLSYTGLDVKKDLKDQSYPQATEDVKTWYDYFMNSAESQMQQTIVLYEAALADKDYTIDYDSVNAEVDEAIATYVSYAKQYNITSDYYFSHMFGSHVTEKIVREVMTMQEIAAEYSTEVYNRNVYEEADWNTYYEENLNSFLKVDYLKYDFKAETTVSSLGDDATEEEKAAAELADEKEAARIKEIAAACAELTTPEEFNEYVRNYLRNDKYKDMTDEELEADSIDIDSLVDSCKVTGATLSSENDLNTWLSSSERVANETYVSSNETTSTVYMILAAPEGTDTGFTCQYRDTYNLASYIYIPFKASDNNDSMDDAKKVADETLADFESGEKTEETFSTIAGNNSGSSYDDATKSKVNDAIDEWVFDSSRKAGDYALVEDENGYYLVYYVETGLPSWQKSADTSLKNDKYDEDYENLEETYKYETVTKMSEYVSYISVVDLSSYASDTTSAS